MLAFLYIHYTAKTWSVNRKIDMKQTDVYKLSADIRQSSAFDRNIHESLIISLLKIKIPLLN